MLTDLSFLNIGQQFPPLSEYDRLEMYQHNKKLFESEHAEVYAESFKRIERVISNFQEVVSYPVVVNYQKLITLKLADLLLGEPPKIVAGETNSKEQQTVDKIIENTDLFNTSYENAIDVSRYGDGLFYVYQDGDNGMIDVTQPAYWYPIVDPKNIKRILYHVIAWTYMIGEAKYLYVQIHSKGSYIEKTYLLEPSTEVGAWFIKAQTQIDNLVTTGLDDFAIVQVPNVVTSDRVHGIDDYNDVDSIISELLVRVGQIARILDKHASPSVTGPMSALERDPVTGEWRLKMGNFFPRDGKDDAETKYITWDGQLEANFKIIDKLVNFLHAISEMGGQLLGDTTEQGGALSGTALRFKMISPLAKAKRVSMRFKPALIKAIRLCSQLGGEGISDLSNVPISVTFLDGLPNDPKEEADIMQIRTGTKATMSIKRALKVYDGMSDEDADNELAEIEADETKANPMLGQTTPFNGNNEPPNNEPPDEGDE